MIIVAVWDKSFRMVCLPHLCRYKVDSASPIMADTMTNKWMTFRKLLIQETEYIQGLGRDAATKRLKTYPIQSIPTPRIDLFLILFPKFGRAITEYILSF
jgi:hypothetical protein